MSRSQWRGVRAMRAAGAIVLGVLAWPHGAHGAVQWTEWTSSTDDFPSSVAVGNLGTTSITYNGSSRIQQTGSGTNYWSPSSPYISATVPNAPTASHMIGVVDYASSHSLTFSAPVTNPVIAIVGLGAPTRTTFTEWTFDAPFQILSYGIGYFGGSGALIDLGGNTLRGDEGSGVIQLLGTFTSVSWTIANGEQPWSDEANITGITVGLIPAPGAVTLLAGAGLVALRRRRER